MWESRRNGCVEPVLHFKLLLRCSPMLQNIVEIHVWKLLLRRKLTTLFKRLCFIFYYAPPDQSFKQWMVTTHPTVEGGYSGIGAENSPKTANKRALCWRQTVLKRWFRSRWRIWTDSANGPFAAPTTVVKITRLPILAKRSNYNCNGYLPARSFGTLRILAVCLPFHVSTSLFAFQALLDYLTWHSCLFWANRTTAGGISRPYLTENRQRVNHSTSGRPTALGV